MAENSKIEWTHHTFNPWRGCTKVSQGCKHCYAETMSGRNPGTLGVWGPQGTRVVAAEGYWKQPLKWDKAAAAAGERHRVFCASLADVFEGPETMPAEAWPAVEAARLRLFNLILQTPNLDWLLLTKRPQNIRNMVPGDWLLPPGSLKVLPYPCGFPPNIWIGTSVEDQAAADERIPHLLRVPARVRFLSCEPLLGPVDLSAALTPQWYSVEVPAPRGIGFPETVQAARLRPRIDWVIAGGESGANARPMHPAWARSLRDQCQAAGVAYFFKQWGEELPKGQGVHGLDERGLFRRESHIGGQTYYRVGKKAAGRLLDGRTWDDLPL
jgi:protein gp37